MSGPDSPVHAYGDLDHEAGEPERAQHALLPGGKGSIVRARPAIVSHDILSPARALYTANANARGSSEA